MPNITVYLSVQDTLLAEIDAEAWLDSRFRKDPS